MEQLTNVANDNVVGRLYNIIFELRESTGENTEAIIQKVFDIPDEKKNELYIYYGELYKMCLVGMEEIQSLNLKSNDKYIAILSDTIRGLSTIYFNARKGVTNNGMDKFTAHFNIMIMQKLESCADFLSEFSTESEVEVEKLQELITNINNIINEVAKSNISKELEKVIISQLNNVRESLVKYYMYGKQGVNNSVAMTLGCAKIVENLINSEEEKNIVKKVFDILGKINIIFSVVNK